VQVDLGGYAKGVALDEAARVLHKKGIQDALVNIGGNIIALGRNGDRPWRVGIQHPRKPGTLAMLDLYDGEAVITHGELIGRVERAAGDLAGRGIGPGARVALCAANTADHVIAYLAILRAGAVWTPLNPRNGARLNAALAARARPDLVLVDADSAPHLGEVAALDLATWLRDLPDAPPPPLVR
jgi:thiamine biosynthesis lipoprotein